MEFGGLAAPFSILTLSMGAATSMTSCTSGTLGLSAPLSLLEQAMVIYTAMPAARVVAIRVKGFIVVRSLLSGCLTYHRL